MHLRIRNLTRDTILASALEDDRGFLRRGIGLLGRKSLAPGGGLRLAHTRLVTMFGMRFAIDLVFVDEQYRVTSVYERVRPWVLARGCRQACEVLELPTGAVAESATQVGDRLEYEVLGSKGSKVDERQSR